MGAMRPTLIVATVLLGGALSSRAAGESDIHEAARLGDLARVVQLLDADPELVNARTAANETPLHYAAAGYDVAIVELLLGRGQRGRCQGPDASAPRGDFV